MTEWNHQFRSVPVVPTWPSAAQADAERIGVRIAATPGPTPQLCDRLR